MPSQPSASVGESEQLYQEARRYLPGGVSAAARLNPAFGRPFFAQRGEGPWVWNVDGRRYIDLNMSFGAALLGHGHPSVRRAVEGALARGLLCGFETDLQATVARRIVETVPCAELVRFTMSGTETTWHAVRTARAYTGRRKVVKFEGHFHGFNDSLGYSMWPTLDEAGPEREPTVIAASAGMTPGSADEVIVLPWNDVLALERCLRARGSSIAAVIMEPIGYNAGTIMPAPGYLKAVRELTAAHGVVLIFDEILSGYRTGMDCAQGYLGVTPDLCTLGKCLGGGMPLSAFAGRREVMAAVAPIGPAVHSGTFNAHTTAVAAAEAFLEEASNAGFWDGLRAKEERFYPGLRTAFAGAGLPVWVQAHGARFSLHFGLQSEPRTYREAALGDDSMAAAFYRAAADRGVYFHHARHHGFSAAHAPEVLDDALGRIEDAAREVAGR